MGRLTGWIRSLTMGRRRVVIPLFVVGLPLVFLGISRLIGAYSYMQENPNFCRACHIMEEAWNRWQTSEHRSISCHSCHDISPIQGVEQLVKFSLNQPEQVSKHAVVQPDACVRCHESDNPRWKQVTDTAGHKIHAKEQNITCVKCHSVTLHRFAPPKTMCQVCHEDKKMAVKAMGELHCLSCHAYLADKDTLEPSREPCLSCHVNKKIISSNGTVVQWPEAAPMRFKCDQCHQPHKQEKPVVDCLTCHPGAKESGLHTKGAHAAATCQTCHAPHQWQVKERTTCQTCHANKQDHYSGVFCGQCHNFTFAKSRG